MRRVLSLSGHWRLLARYMDKQSCKELRSVGEAAEFSSC
jgi:hypothetical protein